MTRQQTIIKLHEAGLAMHDVLWPQTGKCTLTATDAAEVVAAKEAISKLVRKLRTRPE